MGAALKRAKTTDDATYVYCLVASAAKPALRGAPQGVPGSDRVRALDAGRALWAIVSSVPLDRFGEAAIERGLKDLTWVSDAAVGHERVVEHFLGRGTVVPMKLFTIFTSDARAVEHVARQRGSIDPLARRLRGRVELGVRVSLAPRVPRRDRSAGAKGGAEYLKAKRALHDASIELSARAQERIDRVFDTLAAASSEAVRRPIVDAKGGGGRVLLDAAYLVPATRTRRFQTLVRKLARDLAGEGYHITLTGPWPAYNFIGEQA